MEHPAFTAVPKITVTESIVEQFYTLIKNRELHPREVLPSERKLAEILGVGRPALREALNALRSEGMLESRHGGGTFISPDAEVAYLQRRIRLFKPKGHPVLELIEVRFGLETMIASLAAHRRDDEDVSALKNTLSEMEQLFKTERPDVRFHEADRRFHLIIAVSSKNQIACEMLSTISSTLLEGMRISGRLYTASEKALSYHRRIAEAIERFDAIGAREAMSEHLRDVQADLKARLAEDPRGSETGDG